MDGYVSSSVPHVTGDVVLSAPGSSSIDLPGGRVPTVGSQGDKPRKPGQHHLPPVGSKANREYEFDQRKKEVFGGWPIWLAAGLLVLALIGWLFITL